MGLLVRCLSALIVACLPVLSADCLLAFWLARLRGLLPLKSHVDMDFQICDSGPLLNNMQNPLPKPVCNTRARWPDASSNQ